MARARTYQSGGAANRAMARAKLLYNAEFGLMSTAHDLNAPGPDRIVIVDQAGQIWCYADDSGDYPFWSPSEVDVVLGN